MYTKHKIIPDHTGLRIDKWFKLNIKKIPQSLVEKLLRNGKIKVNNLKVKSSYKLSSNDNVTVYNLRLEDNYNNKFDFACNGRKRRLKHFKLSTSSGG